MHPTIEEIIRWRIGEPVRPDVQRRWQQELRELDATVGQLSAQIEDMTKKATPADVTKKAGR